MDDPLPTIPAPGPERPPGAWDWSRVPSPGGAPPSSFGVGDLVGRSFRIWARHAFRFALLGGVAAVPMGILTYQLYLRMPFLARPDPALVDEFLSQLPRLMGSFVLGWLVSVVAMSIAMAAVCRGAAQALRGESVRAAAMLSAAVHRGPYVVAIMLLVTLAALATSCTIAFPVVLLVGWCASVPATVVEGASPIHALVRSWDLTRDHRWQLFAGFAVITACLVGAAMIFQGLSALVFRAVSGPNPDPVRELAVTAAAYQVFAGMLGTLTTVGLSVAHHRLRVVKEGGDPLTLSHVFE